MIEKSVLFGIISKFTLYNVYFIHSIRRLGKKKKVILIKYDESKLAKMLTLGSELKKPRIYGARRQYKSF